MEEKEIIINNKKYVITKWDAISCFTLQVRVTKLVGSALQGISINKDQISNLMQMEVEDLIKNISGLVQNIDEEKFTKLIFDLLSKNIKVVGDAEGQDIKIPVIKEKLEIMEMYELSFEVLKLNLGKFLQDIQLKFKGVSDKKK